MCGVIAFGMLIAPELDVKYIYSSSVGLLKMLRFFLKALINYTIPRAINFTTSSPCWRDYITFYSRICTAVSHLNVTSTRPPMTCVAEEQGWGGQCKALSYCFVPHAFHPPVHRIPKIIVRISTALGPPVQPMLQCTRVYSQSGSSAG
jgi:hypothetical protein